MHYSTFAPAVLLALSRFSVAIPAVSQQTSINPTHAVFESPPLLSRDPHNSNNYNTCGRVTGQTCDPTNPGSGWCCSKYGFCGMLDHDFRHSSSDFDPGNGKKYCGVGCQEKYGRCNSAKVGKQPPKVRYCGPKHKNKKCDKGFCCSSNGLCGQTEAFCGKHCQKGFGRCNVPKTKPKDPKQSKKERCGRAHGGHKCSKGQCCSHAGYCGKGKDYCSVPQNCQRKFGRCDSDAKPAGYNTAKDHRHSLGKLSYGSVINQCKKPKTIALTFDDGPSENTEQLLSILASAGAKATFFISGNTNGKGEIDRTDKWIKAIKHIDAEGHQLASHTWSHPHMNAISSQERKAEMVKNEMALVNIIGKYPTYMRAPYIECDKHCMADMKSLGYHVVSWGTDSQDWKYEHNLDAMTQAVDAGFKSTPNESHMLLIQHDTIPKSSLELTKHILQRVQEKGWKAVTLSECLGESMKHAYRYPKRIEAGALSINGCAFSEGISCGQVDNFNNKEECFKSNQKCFQQLAKHFPTKMDSKDFRRHQFICTQQFLFCALCGKPKAPECKSSKFSFATQP